MKKIKLLVVTFTAAIICMMAIGCGKKDKGISLNDCITYSFEGYDGYGTISCTYDKEKLVEKCDQKVVTDIYLYDRFYTLDKTEDLSNNEEVHLKWKKETISKFEEENNVKFSYEDMKIKVEGLEEVKTIDIFEDLEMTFSGIAPNVTASCSSKKYKDLEYKLSEREGLNEGDVITISVPDQISIGWSDTYELTEYCIENYGGIPVVTSKEYTVGAVPRYADKLADITEEIINKMDTQAQDDMNAHAATSWTEDEKLNSMKLLGNYFLTPKTSSGKNNILYLVYEINVTNPNETLTYYTWYSYENIIILEDGTCSVDIMDYNKTDGDYSWGSLYGDAFLSKGDGGKFFYVGYKSYDSIFNKCVTSYIDKYKYETNIEEK